MKLAAVLGLSIASSAALFAAHSSYAMGKGNLIEVDSVPAVATTNYIYSEGGVTSSGDDTPAPAGPYCETMMTMYKPIGREAEKTIRTNLKAAGYTDQELKNLYVEIIKGGMINFGGDFPGCGPTVEKVEFQGLLPASVVKAHQANNN